MKDTLLSILKYALLLVVVLALAGYLSITGRLPALIPEDMALRMKQISLDTVAALTGKAETGAVRKTAVRPPQGKRQAGLPAEVRRAPTPAAAVPVQNFLYALADRIALGGRLAVMKDFSAINSRKTSEMIAGYRAFVAALAESEPFYFFLANPGREDKKFELKSYLEKFLKDNEDAVGFELRDPRGARLLASSKGGFEIPEAPFRGDFGMASFTAQRRDYVVFAKSISQDGRSPGSFYLVYRADLFRTLVLPEKFGAAVMVLGPGGQLVYGRSNDLDSEQVLQMKASLGTGALPLSVDFRGSRYRAVYAPLEGGFTIASVFRTVSVWQMTLNLLVILLAAGMAVLLVRLFVLLYRNVWLKNRTEKVKKEEVIAGTMSEMVKTLKSTAELTARMAESTREDIGLLEKTIDKIQGGSFPAQADPGLDKADDDWEVVNK